MNFLDIIKMDTSKNIRYIYIDEKIRLRFINKIYEFIENYNIQQICEIEDENNFYGVKIIGDFEKEHKEYVKEAVKQHFSNNFAISESSYNYYGESYSKFTIYFDIYPKKRNYITSIEYKNGSTKTYYHNNYSDKVKVVDSKTSNQK